jgi:hypothetical protein
MILEVKADLKESKLLGEHWSKNDLIICVAEILKWSVNLRRKEGNDGKQFFQEDLFVPVGRDGEYLINSRVIVPTTLVPLRL